MHVSKVELENFKSHADSVFEFARGTTSIIGENGAGKTSIIEAIAWAMFDTLDYRKEDVVRRGEKKAAVRVTFESGLDEREYTVYRDTGTGYYVYDPRLATRIAEKKEEVTRFLWQHLGIEPGTDLQSLYSHAIGVPQGTFTAIFLATAAERKKTFDSLLKVEEYRKSADELLRTVRFVEHRITDVGMRIARAEGEITQLVPLEEQLAAARADADERTKAVAALDADLGAKRLLVAGLDAKEKRMNEARAEAVRLGGELSRIEIVLKERRSELERGRAAADVLDRVRDDHQAYQVAEGRLKEFERERLERQKLRDELNRTEIALNSVQAERSRLAAEIERSQAARAELERLQPLSAEQDRVERLIDSKRKEAASAEAAAKQLEALEKRIVELRDAYKSTSERLKAATESVPVAASIDRAREREATVVKELAAAIAALERDQRFQREIVNGLCPILSEKCLNLKEGQTLDAFVSSQFEELHASIDRLTGQRRDIESVIKAAREAELLAAQVPLLEGRLKEITDEGLELRARKESAEKDAAESGGLQAELAKLGAELAKLDNPKGKIAILSSTLEAQADLTERFSLAEKNIERLESDRRITVEELEKYKDLDGLFAAAANDRERFAEAYRAYVANESAAARVAEAEAAFAALNEEREQSAKDLAAANAEAEAAERGYDGDLHAAERAALTEIQAKSIEGGIMLDAAKRKLVELEAEVARLSSIRASLADEFRERERLERTVELTEFIRSTLKEAAPLVARNYVRHVSLEANLLFREIGGNAERTLTWADDYGIVLEESGHDRPFASLSGGEQMAAAISVRLALLKQLSDIRIAFFDEPTTNMDAERRENLAMQISQISHFDQLFVISHDDSFEGYLDHEVRVGE